MWKIVYNGLLLLILPIFIIIALSRRKLRANLRERLLPKPLAPSPDSLYWIHAASVGEAVIAEALMAAIDRAGGRRSFLITTNTYYTRDLLNKRLQQVQVRSLPFDLPWSLSRFLGEVRPACLIIVETEIWPNLIWIAGRRGIPVFIVNGRLSDRTVVRYRKLSFFFREILEHVTLIMAQSGEHAKRFLSLGLKKATVVDTGNIKYVRDISAINNKEHDHMTITFGSIRDNELDIMIPVIQRLHKAWPGLRLFVAPRQLDLVEPLQKRLGSFTSVALYSAARDAEPVPAGTILVDTVGDLTGLYGMSAAAFVGGSMAPFGGHNMIEPLLFGTPVLFGPYTENFHDAAEEIVACGAGRRVFSGDELFDAIDGLLNDPVGRDAMGLRGVELVRRQQEAMDRTVKHIEKVVSARRA